MKYLKIAGISIIQTVLIYIVNRLILHYSLSQLIPDAASSIGIIGGADGPTAIFTASSKNYSHWMPEFGFSVFILLNVANLAAQIKDRTLSRVIFSFCCFLTLFDWSQSMIFHTIGAYIIIILSTLIIMFSGYLLSRKI